MPRKCLDSEPAATAKLPPHREPRNDQQQESEERTKGARETYAPAPNFEGAVFEGDAGYRAEEDQDRPREALYLQPALRLVGETLQKLLAAEDAEGHEEERDNGEKNGAAAHGFSPRER